MPRSVPAAFLRAFLRQTTDDGVLVLLTITHSLLGVPIRAVLNTEDVVSNGDTYQRCLFDITLPDENPNQAPRARLRIDNIDRSLVAVLRAAANESPEIQITVVTMSDPDTPVLVTPPLKWRSVKYNPQFVEGDLSGPAFINRRYPKDVYSPQVAPGIHKAGP